jgi:hypothetical protein
MYAEFLRVCPSPFFTRIKLPFFGYGTVMSNNNNGPVALFNVAKLKRPNTTAGEKISSLVLFPLG